MSVVVNRVTVGDTTVRLYWHRKDASAAANQRTRLTDRQHRVVPCVAERGYLVVDVVQTAYFDTEGALLAPVVKALLEKKPE